MRVCSCKLRGNTPLLQRSCSTLLRSGICPRAQGLEQAACQLGVMVMFSLGVDVHYTQALRLYGQAAEQGYAEAYCRIAHCYDHGYGVVSDRAAALRLCQRSMAGGYKGAEFKLKSMCE